MIAEPPVKLVPRQAEQVRQSKQSLRKSMQSVDTIEEVHSEDLERDYIGPDKALFGGTLMAETIKSKSRYNTFDES